VNFGYFHQTFEIEIGNGDVNISSRKTHTLHYSLVTSENNSIIVINALFPRALALTYTASERRGPVIAVVQPINTQTSTVNRHVVILANEGPGANELPYRPLWKETHSTREEQNVSAAIAIPDDDE
jgi:hypothetical protein